MDATSTHPGHQINELAAERPTSESSPHVNVGGAERWVSGLGGTLLVAAGLKRGSYSGLGMAILGGSLIYRSVTGHCQAYSALGIDTAHDKSDDDHLHKGYLAKASVTVNRSAEDLYRAWKDIESAPRFMVDVESVRKTDDRHSHWVTRGPLGTKPEWDSEVFRDDPNHLIAWKTLPGADIAHAGTVRFDPATGGRGTVVTLEINYEPPGGPIGKAFAKLTGNDPSKNVREDLRRFKQLMEAGELATVEGQSSGRAASAT